MFALTHADSVSSTSTQLAGKAELELCKSIELVRGSASIQGCDAATKIELASRARAQLGLPVVKMVMDNVDSGADLMLTVGPSHVVRGREAPIVTERGIPSLRIAHIRIAGNRKVRKTAAAQIRAVIGAGNP